MSLETTVRSLEDQLHEQLDYSLPGSAQYIIERRSVAFQPAAGDGFSPNGVRSMTFRMSGTGFIDPSTIRLAGTITPVGATPLAPCSPAHGMFSEGASSAVAYPVKLFRTSTRSRSTTIAS